MKLVVALRTSSTGGLRYLHLLLSSVKKNRPDWDMKVLITDVNSYIEEDFIAPLTKSGIKVEKARIKYYRWKLKSNNKLLNKFINQVIRKKLVAMQNAKLEKVTSESDLAFFPWPYFFDCPDISIPKVFIPHDFNYTHSFGGLIYYKQQSDELINSHKKWLKEAHPVVSTNFIAQELKNAFPDYEKEVDVIHLSKLTNFEAMNEDKTKQVIEKLGIEGDYILNINNTTYHKNLSQVFGGYYYFKQKHPGIKLVLVGSGTEGYTGDSNSPYYIDLYSAQKDVIPLGVVSDEEVNALIQCAKCVINASLYEAGNGSGLDAWSIGTPVVMSDIEPFKEHLDILGVKAQLFNPKCCYEMANALNWVLENPELAKQDAEISKRAMDKYTWDIVAEKYIAIFEKVVRESNENKD